MRHLRASSALLAAGLALAPALAAAQEDLTNPIGGQRPPTGIMGDPPVQPKPPEPKGMTPEQILMECVRQLASGAKTCTIPGG